MGDPRPIFWIRRDGTSRPNGMSSHDTTWYWVLEDADGHVVTEEARRHRSVDSCRTAIDWLQRFSGDAEVRTESEWDAFLDEPAARSS